MTEKYHEDFNISTKSWICKKAYEDGLEKVKDHDHVTGKYQAYAYQVCNLNLNPSRKCLLHFIICKIMIQILSFNKL